MRLTSNTLDLMCSVLPSPQNAVNIFQGNWASALPKLDDAVLQAGKSELFDDERIRWAADQVGGFEGMSVLELGPLEGGHSYMMQRMGAASVLGIEANSRSFLKCLTVKEIYGLDRCHFRLGNFVTYLQQTHETFDFCLASGVLYHMEDPVELLRLIAKVSNHTMIWTQYYDAEIIRRRMPLWKRSRFSRAENKSWDGLTYSCYRRRYGLGLRNLNFWGGIADHSYWMELSDIIKSLKYFGFMNVEIGFHEPEHVNGPAVCLACSKE